MSHFPVISSTLSAIHLAHFIGREYGFEEIRCRLLRAGINDTYSVQTNQDKYVFRVYSLDWRTQEEINEEIGLLLQLHEAGISVSYPLPDRQGNYLQRLEAPEGPRWGLLFTYAAGEKLHNYNATTHEQIGSLMADQHRVLEGQSLKRMTYTAETVIKDAMKELSIFLPEDTEEWQMMEHMQNVLLREWASADIAQLRQGIVHLDFWFDNLNITREGKITLFDFDFCGNGWLCLDIAYYLMQLQLLEPIAQEYRLKTEAFLRGYEKVTTLSAEEKRLLPMLGVSLYFFYIGVQCRRFENFSSIFISETYLKRYISQRIKKYFDFHGLV